MDKKKIQDFISKLQEMATHLTEPDQEAETGVEASAAVEESQNVENHAVHASVDTVSVKSHSIGNVSDYATNCFIWPQTIMLRLKSTRISLPANPSATWSFAKE